LDSKKALNKENFETFLVSTLFPDDVDLRAINLNFLDSKNDDKEDKDY
jgi:hypothetical protein